MTGVSGSLLFFCSAASVGVLAQAEEIAFIRQFGTAQGDSAYRVAVYSGTGDKVYVVGTTYGKFPGQVKNGSGDVFVRQYSGTGGVGWTRQFGTPDYDSSVGVAVDASGVYVVGTTWGTFPGQNNAGRDDVFVRKYNVTGNIIWTRQFGTPDFDWAADVAVDASGLYVVGTTRGAVPGQTSSGNDDVFVRKYNAAGDVIWTRQFGSAAPDEATAVSVEANAVYVAGGTYGFLPNQTNGGMIDAFLRKYDANGNLIWTRQFGGGEEDWALGITVKGDSVYVAGIWQDFFYEDTHSRFADAYLRKYNLAGTLQWHRRFGTPDQADWASSVAAASDGVYVCGEMSYGKTYVRKYGPHGGLAWARQFVPIIPADLELSSLETGATGLYAVGFTDGKLPGNTNKGGYDAFLVKFSNSNLAVQQRD